MMQRQVANDVLMPQIGAMLSEGRTVTIRAVGRSMAPYIHDRRDSLVISPVSPEDVVVDDIVLGRVSDGRYVVHRVVAINQDGSYTLFGDGNISGTELCPREGLMGRVVAIERNGRRIDCNTRRQRAKAWMMRTTRRAVIKTGSRIKHLFK